MQSNINQTRSNMKKKKIKVIPPLPIQSNLQLNQAEHYTPAAQKYKEYLLAQHAEATIPENLD